MLAKNVVKQKDPGHHVGDVLWIRIQVGFVFSK